MLSVLLVVTASEAKKPKTAPAPPVGWYREPAAKNETGWAGDCYYPPDFDKLAEGERKMARQEALEGMKQQWSGTREDGVSIEAGLVEEVEIVLLGRPTQIEAVSRSNRDYCVGLMKGTGTLATWQSYLSGLPAKLTAGECLQPLTYTLFDYLDIGNSWQRPIPMCAGDKAHIIATVKDRYRISESGEWINVEGDTAQKAVGAEWPCNIEGCYVGMLVGKFTTESGVETVFPIGADTTWTAPEHGTLTYSINDTAWYDNRWFKSSTIEDKTAITIEPGQ